MWGAAAAALCLLVSGCAGAGALGGSGERTVTIAMVSNSQMQDAIKLAPAFEAENPGIDLKFVSLSENQRAPRSRRRRQPAAVSSTS